MAVVISQVFATELVAGSVTAAVPLLLAGMGEQISEQAGVLNVGIEGMMLAGAYAGFVAAYDSGAMWAGFACGAAAGAAVACVMVLGCVRLALNQIVVGIALTLGLEGLTSLLHHFQFSRSYPLLPKAPDLAIPGLSAIPVLGPAVFSRHPLVYVALALCVFLAWMHRATFLGLDLAAAGEKPAALDAAGVDVVAIRTAAVLSTGALAGLGGAYLSEVGAGIFVPFMTNGAGFIGIVLAMLARGRPLRVLAGALLFGACLSATTALQVLGVNIPTDIIQMLPFAMVMLVLVAFGRRASLPAALGLPYRRGSR
ncbi:MAG TPA: ABC transporter permease [Acetobacteraceae bacterium]|nr:ABC transporter permease [Acetobacteraceae bacterium]